MAVSSSTNLDVNGLVSQLMTVERYPLTVLDQKEASYQAKISAFGTIRSALASLQSSVQTLTQPNTFKALSVSSTDINVVSGSATTAAAPGTYNVVVDKIAKNHAVRSNDAYTSTGDTLNTGTLSIQVGSGATVDVEITNSNNTLTGIRDAINSSGAGVSASIINDGTNPRLVLNSKTMGSSGAITVTATDSGSGGTFALSGLDSTNLVQTQAADDAQLTVNGLTVTRSSNSVSDVVDGLTLTLGKTGSSTISVAKNTTSITTALTAFVTAYNAVVSQNKSLSAYDATSETSSILTGDATLRSIQNKLGSLIGSSVTGVDGGLSRLSNVGISLQKDGTLTLDSVRLAQALNKPDSDISSLFTQTTTGNKGLAVQMNDWLQSATSSSGLIANRVDSFTSSIDGLDDQRERLNDRLVLIEARYRKQFTALDSLISNMNTTSSFLEQQLSALPGVTKK